VAGAIAALVAVVVALRRSDVPVVAGRALCVVAGAPVVALTGIAGSPASAAIAAGICAVLLATALTPAWEHVGRGRSGRVLGSFSLGAAGALPLGFGITALILELSAAVAIGRQGAALLAALGVAGLLGAAAAAMAALRLFTASEGHGERSPSLLAAVAAIVSLIAALVPGTIATSVLVALSSGGVTEPIGAAALRTEAGDWAGGYIVVAFVIVAAGVWAFATLVGWRPAPAPRSDEQSAPAPEQPVGLGVIRRLRPAAARGATWLHQTDAWLVVQPQLVVVLGGAILAIVLVQLIH
jgi:hypothetical protein